MILESSGRIAAGRRRWPRLAVTPGAIVILSIVAGSMILSFRPIYEPDLWWHVAQGRENAAGRLVRTNLFSFNYPDHPQPFTSWMFDTTTYLAWLTLGPTGIQTLQTTLLVAALVLLYLGCRSRAPTSIAAAILIVGFFILEPRAIPRPHLVSFVGMAACPLLIERASARRTVTQLWWAIPCVALWSNFHAECVFGVLLIAIFAGAELLRPSVLTRRDAAIASVVALSASIATMANPYGWGLFRYLYENWRLPQLASIAELQPPPIPTYPAFYVYLVACAALVFWRWRDVRLWEVIAVGAFAALGLQYLRLTPLVLLASAPFVAARLATSARRLDPRLILAVALCIGIALSRVPIPVLFGQLAAGSRAVEPKAFFSADAIAFMRQAGLEGRVFNSYNLGGYLAWMLYPRVRIFQDSRTQAYPREHFLSILVASHSPPDWEVLVADVDWAVLSVARPNQLSGVGNFPASEWGTVFKDGAVEILVRRRGKYARLVAVNSQRPIELASRADANQRR